MPLVTWLKGVFKNNKPSPADKILAPIEEQLQFAPSRHLTLGIELELAVLDPTTFDVSQRAQAIIDKGSPDRLHQESGAHVVELVTGICNSVQDAEADLINTIKGVAEIAAAEGIAVCGGGRLATLRDEQFMCSPSDRSAALYERRKIIHNKINSVQGMHIHIGMRSADECIRYHNFFVHFLPHLLALSAATPFENGVDTGLATIRPTVTDAHPVSGLPYNYSNWNEYENLSRVAYKAGSITSLKDQRWDLRPCPRFGTLEVRICDQPATLAEGMAIIAFVHGLAQWFEEHHGWLDEMPRPSNWRLRENKWRAIRYGLDAELVVNNQGETRGMKTDILLWLERISPYITRYHHQRYIETLRQMMARGNGSQRQRRLFELTGDLKAVCDFNVREWQNGAPLWDELDALQQQKEAVRPITPLYAGI